MIRTTVIRIVIRIVTSYSLQRQVRDEGGRGMKEEEGGKRKREEEGERGRGRKRDERGMKEEMK